MAHEPGTVLKPVVKLPRDLNTCWPWQGTCNEHGTPLKQWNGRPKAARRWLYELLFGVVPDGLVVYNTCGTRECVNPAHLARGYVADCNRTGERAILSEADVKEAKRRSDDEPIDLIAADLGVSPSTLSDALAGRSWAKKKKKRKSPDPQLKLF